MWYNVPTMIETEPIQEDQITVLTTLLEHPSFEGVLPAQGAGQTLIKPEHKPWIRPEIMNIQLCMQQPQKHCEQEAVQGTVTERGASPASSATADNALLFPYNAVLFRALFGNSMMTCMQSARVDACAPLVLFSPWLIFHPPRPPKQLSAPYVHDFIEQGYTVLSIHSFCLPVPIAPKSHRVHLAVAFQFWSWP